MSTIHPLLSMFDDSPRHHNVAALPRIIFVVEQSISSNTTIYRQNGGKYMDIYILTHSILPTYFYSHLPLLISIFPHYILPLLIFTFTTFYLYSYFLLLFGTHLRRWSREILYIICYILYIICYKIIYYIYGYGYGYIICRGGRVCGDSAATASGTGRGIYLHIYIYIYIYIIFNI